MGKSLQILKSVKRFLSLINSKISLVSIVFVLQECFGYTPGNIKSGKYRFGFLNYMWQMVLTDGGAYGMWGDKLVENYGSVKGVWESTFPSVYVDNNGDLYTICIQFMSIWGARYNLSRVSPDGTTKSTIIDPWRDWCGINLNGTNVPKFTEAQDSTWFKHYIHNCFSPCIAQDVSDTSDVLNIFFYVPPTRYMNGSIDKEGLLHVKLRKSDFSKIENTFYDGKGKNNQYSFNKQYSRTNEANHVFGPEFGNYKAWAFDGNVHVVGKYLATADNHSSGMFYNWHNGTINGGNWLNTGKDNLYMSYRVLKREDYVFMLSMYHSYGTIFYFLKSAYGYGEFLNFDISSGLYRCLNHQGNNNNTKYDYDFCIVDGEGTSPIFCKLGFCTTSRSDTRTSLRSNLNTAWSYVSWGQEDIVLMLCSCPWNFKEGHNYYYKISPYGSEDPQNVIYSTGQKSFVDSCSVDCTCSDNTNNAYGVKQLFKNTHKICTYEAENGDKYIIYCYCYPGKATQLYLGYARYTIEDDKIRLLTKMEFRAGSEQWSDSFGDFTVCSRIVSMDCKNGNLWITWLDDGLRFNGELCCFNYFYIKAKDLIGE